MFYVLCFMICFVLFCCFFRTGSGKSSLLYMIMQELPVDAGTISVHGSMSYSSQEAWIRGGLSVRENILFGQPYEAERYNKARKIYK